MSNAQLSQPWAIDRGVFNEIRTGLGRNPDAVGNRSSRNREQGFDVINGVAVLTLTGILTRGFDLVTAMFGGTSTEVFAQDFLTAVTNPDIKAIIINIDSPGGTVNGTAELADIIFENRGSKPIVALANGTALSAAYWIASATDKIFISGSTAQVGSIGVISTHVDVSEAAKMQGVRVTEIVSGRFKALGSPHKPLSDEDQGTIQERVDHLFSIFVAEVSIFRNVTAESILKPAGEAQVLIGLQSLKAGLADGVASLNGLIDSLAGGETFGIEINKLSKGMKVMDKSLTLEQRAEQRWQNDPEIQEEFKSLDTFQAYIRAVDAGQLKLRGEDLKELFG